MMELIEHTDATAEDRRAFAALVSQLPEASDTAAFSRAHSMLSAPSRRPDTFFVARTAANLRLRFVRVTRASHRRVAAPAIHADETAMFR